MAFIVLFQDFRDRPRSTLIISTSDLCTCSGNKPIKVQISRDVRFDEKLVWNWEKQLVEVTESDSIREALNDCKVEDAVEERKLLRMQNVGTKGER